MSYDDKTKWKMKHPGKTRQGNVHLKKVLGTQLGPLHTTPVFGGFASFLLLQKIFFGVFGVFTFSQYFLLLTLVAKWRENAKTQKT